MRGPLRQTWMRAGLLLIPLLFVACGGGGGGDSVGGNGGGSSDVLRLAVDGGGEATYSETYDSATVCDPRVDWVSTPQIMLLSNFNGSQWTEQLVITFDLTDAVGVYDVTAGEVMAQYITGGVLKAAWDLSTYSNSFGTVTVTQSDSRIKGSFALVVVDDTNSNPTTLTGSFDVGGGITACLP